MYLGRQVRSHGPQAMLDPFAMPTVNLVSPEKLAKRKELEAEMGALSKEVADERERLTELAQMPDMKFDSVEFKNYRVGMMELSDKRERLRDLKVDIAMLPDPEAVPLKREPNAFERWVKGGVDALSTEEVKDFIGPYDGVKQSKGADTFRVSDFIRHQRDRAQAHAIMAPTRSDDASGSQGVGLTIDPTVVQALKAYGGAVEHCRAVRTATGDTRRFLHMDDTSEEGEWLTAQNSQISSGDVDFAGTEMTAKTLTSKFVTVSVEFLADDESNMAGIIQDLCYRRIGRAMNKYVTKTQANFPNSILDCIQANFVKSGVADSFGGNDEDWKKLIDIIGKVPKAYRSAGEGGRYGFMSEGEAGNRTFMMHSDMELVLMKLSDGDKRPIIQPNLQGAWEDFNMNGRPYVVNDHMDQIAAGTTPLVWFNGNYYVFRFVGEMQFERFYDSRTAQTQTVQFLAKTRGDFGPILYTAGDGRNAATRCPWGAGLKIEA